MAVPEKLKRFISDAQYGKLRLDELDAEDRASVLDVLIAAFEGLDLDDVNDEDVVRVLGIAQGYADDLREPMDDSGFDKEEVAAAEAASDGVIEDMNSKGEDE